MNAPLLVSARALRWQVYAATWMSYAGFYVTRKVFSVVKGPVKLALAVDDRGVAGLWTTYLVAYFVGQFFSAWLSRRVSNKTQVLVGMSVSVACNVAMGLLLDVGPSAYGALAVVMAVHGVAQATGWPCNVGIMASWTTRAERGRVMALWGTCYQLGAVGAKAFASFVFGALVLLWSFWAASAVLAVVVVAYALFARERPAVPFEDDPPPPPSSTSAPDPLARRRLLLIYSMGVLYFAFKSMRYALDSWSPLILSEHFHLETATAGYLSTAFDWVGFLGVISAGFLSDRVFKGSRITVIALMTFGCVVATGLLWSVGLSSVPAFVVLLGVVGFMDMGPDSLLSGAAAMDTGSARQAATAAGIINGCGSLGPILQEPVIGWLKTEYGADAVLLLLVGMAVLAAAGVTLFWARVRRLHIAL